MSSLSIVQPLPNTAPPNSALPVPLPTPPVPPPPPTPQMLAALQAPQTLPSPQVSAHLPQKEEEEGVGLFEEGFGEYLESGLFSDIDIVHVDTNTTYRCHRVVLSHSSLFFRRVLEEEEEQVQQEQQVKQEEKQEQQEQQVPPQVPPQERDNKCVKRSIRVQFSEEGQVFGKLLKFLYSGEAELSTGNVVSMQLAAKQFQVETLSAAIEKFLDANFTADNVFAVLDRSVELDEVLRKRCVAFIAKQFDKLAPQIKERLFSPSQNNMPIDLFLDIIGHEHLKEQGERRSQLVMELVTEFVNKHNVMKDKQLLAKVLDAVLASNTLNSDSATMFLVHCDKLELKRQAAGCAQVLAANFYTLKDKTFIFELSCEAFCSLLRSDDLFIKSEDSVFEIAEEYVKKNAERLSLQQQREVMATIRFTFLSIDKLYMLKDTTSELIDFDSVVCALWARLYRLEKDKEEEKALYQSNPNLLPRKNRIFLHTSDFDKNGILYWLGTNYGTEKYQNPHLRGNATVSHSANCEVGKTPDLISHEPCTCNLVSSANTTVTIKLHDYSVMPTSYTLRHTTSRDSECLRNWKFQGSVDGTTYVDLSVHQNDTSLNVKGGTKTWQLSPATVCDYYQYFRILQDGNNSSNNTYLSMAGFELYGSVMKLIHK